MKVIPLTQGKEALVDDEDFEYLSQFSWHAIKSHTKGDFYAKTSIKVGDQYRGFMMHKMLLREDGMITDHVSGNTLNNQKANLRLCTVSQNGVNRRSGRNSTSKYLGVSWCKNRKKWLSTVTVNGKGKKLGSFDTALEAAIITNIAMRKYYGEFARPNKL